jgi:hypothetical protein
MILGVKEGFFGKSEKITFQDDKYKYYTYHWHCGWFENTLCVEAVERPDRRLTKYQMDGWPTFVPSKPVMIYRSMRPIDFEIYPYSKEEELEKLLSDVMKDVPYNPDLRFRVTNDPKVRTQLEEVIKNFQ